MLVYRFLHTQYALDALQNSRLKVGRVSELNDPMDCAPRVVNYPPASSDVLNHKFEQEVLDRAANALGLLCFSGTLEDPVVWSHYADCHRGIALGFSFANQVTTEVKYDDKRCDLDYPRAFDLQGNFNREALVQGFARKAKSWKYEQEHRIFLDLDRCTMVGEHYFFELPKLALKQVVLGVKCRLNGYDISRVLQHGHGATILRARMDQQYYRMNIAAEVTGRAQADLLQFLTEESDD